MKPGRLLRHLFTAPGASRRVLSDAAMKRLHAVVADQEARHGGEIVFAVEAALPWSYLRRDAPARQRAIMAFSKLRVWDTEENCGVLIYLLLADRDVEIVADRGIAQKVAQAEWEAICRRMEAAFRARRFEDGIADGIRAVGDLLARHFPSRGADRNELPDEPVRL